MKPCYSVSLSDIRFRCYIGVHPAERKRKTQLSADITMDLSACQAVKTDRIEDTVDYAEVYRLIRETADAKNWATLEALAGKICGKIRKLENVKNITLTIRKPSPPGLGKSTTAGFTITQSI